jgi:hypothetical protein
MSLLSVTLQPYEGLQKGATNAGGNSNNGCGNGGGSCGRSSGNCSG